MIGDRQQTVFTYFLCIAGMNMNGVKWDEEYRRQPNRFNIPKSLKKVPAACDSKRRLILRQQHFIIN